MAIGTTPLCFAIVVCYQCCATCFQRAKSNTLCMVILPILSLNSFLVAFDVLLLDLKKQSGIHRCQRWGRRLNGSLKKSSWNGHSLISGQAWKCSSFQAQNILLLVPSWPIYIVASMEARQRRILIVLLQRMVDWHYSNTYHSLIKSVDVFNKRVFNKQAASLNDVN